ncbi:hypothetical protein C5167_037295 [Papaver somniferum]|uniref:Ribosomal RNA methyltransferase FtsJ domain-containing protein n=1 Tax=Papaver somniferum TaxID=3469 RepID=A0A4Y7I8I7_PAPSO|nr:hypothetical protein C5167_037295 [Papaver somniferum]
MLGDLVITSRLLLLKEVTNPIITVPEKTSQALESACRLMGPGGLISVMVYVGHPGGREEYETIQSFASGLPSESWVCCKFEMLNRPLAPVLVLLFKK